MYVEYAGLNENVLKINGSNVSSFYRIDKKKREKKSFITNFNGVIF